MTTEPARFEHRLDMAATHGAGSGSSVLNLARVTHDCDALRIRYWHRNATKIAQIDSWKNGRNCRCNGDCLLFITSILDRLMDDHPLTHDRWSTPDDAEFVTVRHAELWKMERACFAIWAIARIVGNSANEPETSGSRPPGMWVMSNLIGRIESLCDHFADLVASTIDESNIEENA